MKTTVPTDKLLRNLAKLKLDFKTASAIDGSRIDRRIKAIERRLGIVPLPGRGNV